MQKSTKYVDAYFFWYSYIYIYICQTGIVRFLSLYSVKGHEGRMDGSLYSKWSCGNFVFHELKEKEIEH
jgi:hypothetical protein